MQEHPVVGHRAVSAARLRDIATTASMATQLRLADPKVREDLALIRMG
jgi:hypothetical protein